MDGKNKRIIVLIVTLVISAVACYAFMSWFMNAIF